MSGQYNIDFADSAPMFEATCVWPGKDLTHLNLVDFKGKKIVLYFYPKDNTSGCSAQAQAFRDHHAQFIKANAVVIGVSPDSIESHKKFIEKNNLNFPLVSDEDKKLANLYGVWAEKSMYGKKYMGIERTTFVIDENGTIQHVWRKVKVPRHIEAVLAYIKEG